MEYTYRHVGKNKISFPILSKTLLWLSFLLPNFSSIPEDLLKCASSVCYFITYKIKLNKIFFFSDKLLLHSYKICKHIKKPRKTYMLLKRKRRSYSEEWGKDRQGDTGVQRGCACEHASGRHGRKTNLWDDPCELSSKAPSSLLTICPMEFFLMENPRFLCDL